MQQNAEEELRKGEIMTCLLLKSRTRRDREQETAREENEINGSFLLFILDWGEEIGKVRRDREIEIARMEREV